ncbi:MAG: GGDEF domain-containing protein [Sulfuricurvum sp.]
MKNIHEKHIAITRAVKEAIHGIQVVFPARYAQIYRERAKELQIDLSPETMIDREMLDEKMVRHILTLSECTAKAIDAMETEDLSLLKIVLEKTRQLQEEVHELEKLVYEDSLTKSFNRKWFEDTMLEVDHLHIRGNGTIVLIDLNDFKSINDTYGHIVGDKVLIFVARKLKESGGRIVRYGGDEFLIIFDEVESEHSIQQKIDALLHYFSSVMFKNDTHAFKISFSYGTARFHKGSDVDNVIREADKAMYHSKNRRKMGR